MNVKLFTTIRSVFVKKAPKAVETVAKKVAPVVKKEPQLKYVPADTVTTYLSPEMKEIAGKYKTMVAFDKNGTYLSYKKSPQVHVRKTFAPDGRYMSSDLKFADGRAMHTEGRATYGAYCAGSSVLKDKDGAIIKKVTWNHKPEVSGYNGSRPKVEAIETTVREEFYKGGKLDHGKDVLAKYTKPHGVVFDSRMEVVDKEKNILEYSIPAQRKVESTVYQESGGDKIFKTAPKISLYPEEEPKVYTRGVLRGLPTIPRD